jgi:hypothetical protein
MEQGMTPGILKNVAEKTGETYGRIESMGQRNAQLQRAGELDLLKSQEELNALRRLGQPEVASNGAKVAGTTTDAMGNTTLPRKSGSGTNAAQNGTSVQGSSGNPPVRVQGATGVQGASRPQGAVTMDYRPERDVVIDGLGTSRTNSLAKVDNPLVKFSASTQPPSTMGSNPTPTSTTIPYLP